MSTMITAIANTDIDLDRVTETPDGVITIDLVDGSTVAVGSEPMDEQPDTPWWSATWRDGSQQALVFEGTDRDALVTTLADMDRRYR